MLHFKTGKWRGARYVDYDDFGTLVREHLYPLGMNKGLRTNLVAKISSESFLTKVDAELDQLDEFLH